MQKNLNLSYNRVIAIIPALNEEKNIRAVISGIKKAAPLVHVLVVDDGSTDNTAGVAKKNGAKVINLPFNMGYGAALQTGFKYALRHGFEFAVQIDGDCQHDPASLPELLLPIITKKADVALGSRFLGAATYPIPIVRKTGIIIFGAIVSAITGKKITDPTSGYQALGRAAITRLYASSHYPADFPDADVIIMLHRAGLKVCEVPVVMHPSPDNKSMHKGVKPLYYVFKMFLSIFLAMLRKNPF